MTSPHRISRPVLVVLATAGLLLAACGSNSGVAAPAAVLPSASSASPADPPASSGSSLPTAGAPDTAAGGIGAGADATTFVPLDMSVRVVNLFLPKGSTSGTAVDVWAGYGADSSSKKLITVPYGQVSDYFAPAISGSQGSASAHTSYTLTFYPAGNTTDVLGQQSESASPKQKLTMTLAPGDSTGVGGQLQVAADQLGTSPEGGGFTTTSIPKAPAGKAIVVLSALGLESPVGNSSSTSLQLSSSSGTCELYIDPGTGRPNDPTSGSTELTGGSSQLAYIVQPGAQVGVNQVKANEDVTTACHDQPVASFDPKLSAGQGAYAFVYGADVSTAKVLVVPVG